MIVNRMPHVDPLISIQDAPAILADEVRAAAQLAGHLRRDLRVARGADAALNAGESVGALGGSEALVQRSDVVSQRYLGGFQLGQGTRLFLGEAAQLVG